MDLIILNMNLWNLPTSLSYYLSLQSMNLTELGDPMKVNGMNRTGQKEDPKWTRSNMPSNIVTIFPGGFQIGNTPSDFGFSFA